MSKRQAITLTVSTLALLVASAGFLYGQRPAETVGRPPLLQPKATAILTIPAPTITPNLITANMPTTVTVVVQITDPLLIPGSVNLLRVGATGTQPAIIGLMHDDGIAGDGVAGDHLYTSSVRLNEYNPGPFQVEVSAAFKSALRRVISPPATIAVTGVTLATVTGAEPLIVRGTVSSARSYIRAGAIYTDIQIAVSQTIKGAASQSVTVTLLGGTVDNNTQSGYLCDAIPIGDDLLLLLDGPQADGTFRVPDGPIDVFHIRNSSSGPIAVVDSCYDSAEMAIPLDPSFASVLSMSSQHSLTLSGLIAALAAN